MELYTQKKNSYSLQNLLCLTFISHIFLHNRTICLLLSKQISTCYAYFTESSLCYFLFLQRNLAAMDVQLAVFCLHGSWKVLTIPCCRPSINTIMFVFFFLFLILSWSFFLKCSFQNINVWMYPDTSVTLCNFSNYASCQLNAKCYPEKATRCI